MHAATKIGWSRATALANNGSIVRFYCNIRWSLFHAAVDSISGLYVRINHSLSVQSTLDVRKKKCLRKRISRCAQVNPTKAFQQRRDYANGTQDLRYSRPICLRISFFFFNTTGSWGIKTNNNISQSLRVWREKGSKDGKWNTILVSRWITWALSERVGTGMYLTGTVCDTVWELNITYEHFDRWSDL